MEAIATTQAHLRLKVPTHTDQGIVPRDAAI
jgi:hypothetical protein